ncbi:MAG: acyl-CoA reductase [Flavobacteriales bacterium]|nr:acyl-CoA reductase [Flavobacteriales bacterium]|tara:strand:- start:1532 stop:2542 length:1011 start_codon:yes stop_codon:yes gene_type:complete
MTIESRIQAFVQLGSLLNKHTVLRGEMDSEFELAINRASVYNGWFTQKNIRKALAAIVEMLSEECLKAWSGAYKLEGDKRVAIIMAGNIPLVGFHDLLSVLISGHSALVKMSSDDNQLLPIIVEELKRIESSFADKIQFTKDKMENFDAVIATGSDNSARYFEHYFGKFPNIIRKSRSSVAILDGTESKKELKGLADDVFQYFGLGCRSISKVFLPKHYDLNLLFNAFYEYKEVIDNKKYGNNYDYNKAIYLMGQHEITENGFLIMKQETALKSPVSVLHYELYDDLDLIHRLVADYQEKIQCVVGKGFVPFGKAQSPALDDYADGVDTMAFLESL